MKKDSIPAPLKAVKQWKQTIPGIYEHLDQLAGLKQQGKLQWPDYCKLPIGAAMTFLMETGRFPLLNASSLAAEATACWMWRKNKVIYSFDRDLADALIAQAADIKENDVLPADLLFQLPFPCIYIQAPVLEGFDGFFAWIEYDINEGHSELRIQWITVDGGKSFPGILHIASGQTLKACKAHTARMIAQNVNAPSFSMPQDAIDRVLEPLQLILYLLSENAEVTSQAGDTKKTEDKREAKSEEKADQAQPATSRQIKDQYKEIRTNTVGVYIGAALRKSRKYNTGTDSSDGRGTPVRPHIRRGHWHHYWYGSKGERRLKLKWTAPMVIHAEQGEIGTVIVPVKPEK
ncbi:MAG: AcrVA2 family anti-CRISPR protein [Acutalibacteraceae bacterium]